MPPLAKFLIITGASTLIATWVMALGHTLYKLATPAGPEDFIFNLLLLSVLLLLGGLAIMLTHSCLILTC